MQGQTRISEYQIEYDYIDFAADNAGILLSQNGRKWQTDFDGNITRPFVVDYTNWIYIPGTGDEESGAGLSALLEEDVFEVGQIILDLLEPDGANGNGQGIVSSGNSENT